MSYAYVLYSPESQRRYDIMDELENRKIEGKCLNELEIGRVVLKASAWSFGNSLVCCFFFLIISQTNEKREAYAEGIRKLARLLVGLLVKWCVSN